MTDPGCYDPVGCNCCSMEECHWQLHWHWHWHGQRAGNHGFTLWNSSQSSWEAGNKLGMAQEPSVPFLSSHLAPGKGSSAGTSVVLLMGKAGRFFQLG